MKIIKGPFDINEIINVLKAGGLVIFPCETVYGVAVDSLNSKAVEKLNRYKQRPFGKPYAIMASSQKMAEKYVNLNNTAKNLYKRFLPGPVTVISKGRGKVAKGIESEMGTLGVRIPDYELMIDVINKFGRPIVATSANASYQRRPYKLSDILDNISEKQKGLIDLMIDAGELPHNEPSTVIDTTLDDPAVLRQGEIKFKGKDKILSRSEENTQNTAKDLWQKYEEYVGRRPIVFALEGPMGSGKTQFVKGLARAMGIKDNIVSPTFNIILNYEPRTMNYALTHIDVWRIQDQAEFEALGFVKMLEDKNMVIAIEWAEKVADLIKNCRDDAVIVWIRIDYGRGENERLISWNII